MCGGVKKAFKKLLGVGSSKVEQPKTTTYAPSATVMNSDVQDNSATQEATERQRRKRGFNSTRSGVGNVLAGINNNKSTLG